MKYAIAAVLAVAGLSVASAQAAPVSSAEVIANAVSTDSAVQNVDYHSRWRSHHRWGSSGGWHSRWRSHHRWGSRHY